MIEALENYKFNKEKVKVLEAGNSEYGATVLHRHITALETALEKLSPHDRGLLTDMHINALSKKEIRKKYKLTYKIAHRNALNKLQAEYNKAANIANILYEFESFTSLRELKVNRYVDGKLIATYTDFFDVPKDFSDKSTRHSVKKLNSVQLEKFLEQLVDGSNKILEGVVI